MIWRLGFLIKSAACSVWFRAHGFKSPVVACEGRLPVLYSGGQVTVGRRVSLRSRIAKCELGARAGAKLEIGDGVFINQGASLVAHCRIEIGNDVRIGDFAAIYDSNFHPVDLDHPMKREPVVIGANVWLGRGVVILPGSKVGDHSVVATGCVVKGDVPPGVLVAGNPMRIVRELRVKEGWRRG